MAYPDFGVIRTDAGIRDKVLFAKVRALSNPLRFRMVELALPEELSISALSKRLSLSYTKCADYVRVLEKCGVVSKRRQGRQVLVKAKRLF